MDIKIKQIAKERLGYGKECVYIRGKDIRGALLRLHTIRAIYDVGSDCRRSRN